MSKQRLANDRLMEVPFDVRGYPIVIRAGKKLMSWIVSLAIRTKRRPIAVAAIAGLLLLVTWSAPSASAPSPETFTFMGGEALQTTLANGLRCLVIDNGTNGPVVVNIICRAGSATDPQDKGGLAHLAEHMMFSSSPEHPNGGIQRALSTAAYANALTFPWGTRYVTTCSPGGLEHVLRTEADRLSGLAFSDAEFTRERSVVRQERLYRSQFSPLTDLLHALIRLAYTDSTSGPIFPATDESIRNLVPADVRAFHARNLIPEELTAVVVGPVDPDETLALLAETLGKLAPNSNGEGNERDPRLPSPHAADVRLDRIDFDGLLGGVGVRLPTRTLEERVLSMLVAKVFQHQKMSVSDPFYMPHETFLAFVSIVPASPIGGARIAAKDQAKNLLDSIWGNINQRRWMLEWRESFPEAKGKARREIAAMMSQSERMSDFLGLSLLYDSDLSWLSMIETVLDTLSVERFLAYSDECLDSDKAATAVIHGRDSGREWTVERLSTEPWRELDTDFVIPETKAADLDRALAAYAEMERPGISTGALSNGIPVHLIRIAGAPSSQIGGFRSFDFIEDDGVEEMPGITAVYSFLVNFKYERKTSPRVALPDGIQLMCTSYSLELSAGGETERLKEIAAGLADRLESEEFNHDLMTGLFYAGRSGLPERPNHVSQECRRLRWSLLLGERHPALGVFHVQPALLGEIGEKDLKRLHREVSQTGNLRLFGVSELDAKTFESIMEQSFGKRPKYKERVSSEPITSPLQGVEGYVVAWPDIGDARIEITFPPFTTVIGWAEAMVVQKCLELKLVERLRMKEGLSYTLSTNLVPMGSLGVVEVSTTTFPDASETAFKTLREELESLVETGVSENLMARAKIAVCGRVWRQLVDAEEGYALLQETVRWGAPPPDPIERILAIDLEGLNRDLRLMVNPSQFAFTVNEPNPTSLDVGRFLD